MFMCWFCYVNLLCKFGCFWLGWKTSLNNDCNPVVKKLRSEIYVETIKEFLV